MAVTTWTAGEVLTAADLNDTFASKLPYSYGTATPSTTDSGFLWYDSNSSPAAPKFWTGSAFQALTSGKILQIVRATDTTQRTTTSTTFVDASISVTITPQKSDSAILLIWVVALVHFGASDYARVRITDNSNNAISGAEGGRVGSATTNDIQGMTTVIGYATPATTSATTYKGRYRIDTTGNARLENAENTGQLYAIEVSA